MNTQTNYTSCMMRDRLLDVFCQLDPLMKAQSLFVFEIDRSIFIKGVRFTDAFYERVSDLFFIFHGLAFRLKKLVECFNGLAFSDMPTKDPELWIERLLNVPQEEIIAIMKEIESTRDLPLITSKIFCSKDDTITSGNLVHATPELGFQICQRSFHRTLISSQKYLYCLLRDIRKDPICIFSLYRLNERKRVSALSVFYRNRITHEKVDIFYE